jgi:hypothetical protein
MHDIKLHTHTRGLKFKELGEGARLDIITSKEQKFTHNQKDTTNGAKRVRIEAYKDMALNAVVRVMAKSERANKQRDERRAKRIK